MKDLKNKSWVLAENVEGLDRERIFILLEAAGFRIWENVRNHGYTTEGKKIEGGLGWIPADNWKWPLPAGNDWVFGYEGCEKYEWAERDWDYKFTVEELESELIKMIKVKSHGKNSLGRKNT